MIKLKTLKDCYMSDGRNMEQKIKEEAIKWFKNIDEEIKRIIPQEKMAIVRMFAKQDFIRHFFNITEEDLK